MIKPLANKDVKGILARVSARAVTAVMPESDRLRKGGIDADLASDRRRDLSYFEGMGESGALVVGREDDDLSLTREPSECSGVHNPIAITFEAGALVVGLL
jgi:hypothetical protein